MAGSVNILLQINEGFNLKFNIEKITLTFVEVKHGHLEIISIMKVTIYNMRQSYTFTE